MPARTGAGAELRRAALPAPIHSIRIATATPSCWPLRGYAEAAGASCAFTTPLPAARDATDLIEELECLPAQARHQP